MGLKTNRPTNAQDCEDLLFGQGARSEPAIIPSPDINNPTSWGGQIDASDPKNSNPSQATNPAVMAQRAPCVVALFQNNPAHNGTNAATSVTLYVFTTSL